MADTTVPKIVLVICTISLIISATLIEDGFALGNHASSSNDPRSRISLELDNFEKMLGIDATTSTSPEDKFISTLTRAVSKNGEKVTVSTDFESTSYLKITGKDAKHLQVSINGLKAQRDDMDYVIQIGEVVGKGIMGTVACEGSLTVDDGDSGGRCDLSGDLSEGKVYMIRIGSTDDVADSLSDGFSVSVTAF